MRLQCPNCDAEYEVDAAAIPADGRDVQCSNCGHGWFQSHPDYETDHDLESALYDPPPPLPQNPPSENAFPRREINPAALQILREEAALEEAKRAAELAEAAEAKRAAQVAEAQRAAQAAEAKRAAQVAEAKHPATAPLPADDFADIEANLDAARVELEPMPQIAPRISPRRVARIRGEDMGGTSAQIGQTSAAFAQSVPQDASLGQTGFDQIGPMTQPEPGPGPSGSRRSMAGDGDTKPLRKGGSRLGFYTAVLLGLAALVAYVLGPEIAARIPALDQPMGVYIDGVNALRDGVQQYLPALLGYASAGLSAAIGWLSGLIGG